jgi:hypothetical protein
MGYPANEDAIPDLVEELRYTGSFPPKDDLIIRTLSSVGLPALDSLRSVLANHPDEDMWITSIAVILHSLDRGHLLGLAEVLTRTLEVGLEGDQWYCIPVIDLLARIGPPQGNVALPILTRYFQAAQECSARVSGKELSMGIALAAREARADIRRAAIKAMTVLDWPTVEAATMTVRAAEHDPDPEVCRVATAAFGST